MRDAGKIAGGALRLAGESIEAGMSTKHLDDIIRKYIEKHRAIPSFLGYGGFPGSACISLNNEIIHGIPSKDKILREGDIVKVDVGAYYKGVHGDTANTFTVGDPGEAAKKLIEVTKQSFWRGIEKLVPGNRMGDLGYEIQSYVESFGYSVVRKYIGHGVGEELHESPDVPNYGRAGHGVRFCEGMTLAIEPMVNAGTHEVRELDDDWTVVTADGKLSAHYEHTVAITDNGVVVLTLPED